MTRFTVRMALKEEYYDHTPEHVIVTLMDLSVFAETKELALALLERSVSAYDRYYIINIGEA